MSKKKINRIFLLGDSWIEGQGTYSYTMDDGRPEEPNLPFGPEKVGGINEWRRENSWNKFFKETYGNDIDIINLGIQGSNNTGMFGFLNFIIENDFKDTDLILFGFKIFNLQGQVLVSDQTKYRSSYTGRSINMNAMNSGIYIMQVYYLPEYMMLDLNRNYWVKTIKFIKP